MKRLLVTLVVALTLGGCDAVGSPIRQFPTLVTASPVVPGECLTIPSEGLLVADPTYGTAFTYTWNGSETTAALAWPAGFTARHNGTELAVVNPNGAVVATTGHRYILSPGDAVGLPSRFYFVCDTPIPVP